MGHLIFIQGTGGHMPGTVRPARQAPLVANLRPSHPVYDVEAEPDHETVFVPLTHLEWSLIVSALSDHGKGTTRSAAGYASLAAKVREMVRSRIIHPSHGDDCAPYGLPRPGAL